MPVVFVETCKNILLEFLDVFEENYRDIPIVDDDGNTYEDLYTFCAEVDCGMIIETARLYMRQFIKMAGIKGDKITKYYKSIMGSVTKDIIYIWNYKIECKPVLHIKSGDVKYVYSIKKY